VFASKHTIQQQLDQQYNKFDLNKTPKPLKLQKDCKALDIFFWEFDNKIIEAVQYLHTKNARFENVVVKLIANLLYLAFWFFNFACDQNALVVLINGL
jgi:hypothetical protein